MYKKTERAVLDSQEKEMFETKKKKRRKKIKAKGVNKWQKLKPQQ